MRLDADTQRRWWGALALVGALGMLIAGETILKGQLRDATFILYWLGCFLLTGLAIWLAFLDMRSLSERVRKEHRSLLDNTLKDIEKDAKSRTKRSEDGT